jgi:outer membrane protein, heavy metal efflux system
MEHLNSIPRCRLLAGGTRVVLLFFCLTVQSQAEPIALTLQQALELAETSNPSLNQARAQIDAVDGRREDADAFLFNNPTVSTELGRRSAEGVSNSEWLLHIEQPFELAGQARARRNAVNSELIATRSSIESLRRRLNAEVERRFVRLLAVQARLVTEQEALALIERSAGIVRSRVGAGEDTRLEGNLAEVEVGRMRNRLDRLREELIRSQGELATLLQLPVGTLPEAIGTLTATPLSYSLQDLIASGRRRPTLEALAHRENANRSRLELEQAARYPDLTIGLFTSREGPDIARETISGVTLSLPLPLFKRNAEGIGQAYADLSRTRIEREAAARDMRGSIETVWERMSNLTARLQRLNEIVLPRLDENARLAQVSYRSGEISISELLLANRQIVDVRRDILDATAEYETTRILLEEVAGWSRIEATR